IELLALYWTVCGPAEAHVGREWSLFDWRDRCAEAARVGFKGIGLWHTDISHQLETSTLAEMKRIFDDAGLTHLQVEFLADFVDETVNHRRRPGEGEFDIPGYVEACQEIGYEGPWGVEVLSAEQRALPIDEAFQRAYDTSLAQFRAGVA